MKLNKKQLALLKEISKQNGNRCLLEVGKNVYNTYRMIHINTNFFVDVGLVEYSVKKNKIIPKITDNGKRVILKNTERFIN